MPSSRKVRQWDPASSEDREAVVFVLDHYARDPMGMNRPLDPEVAARLPDDLAGHPTARIFLAFEASQPVGVLVGFLNYSTFSGQPIINIHDLSVLREFRGSGIGQELLHAVEEEAEESGCARLTLEVRSDNPAARLYQRFGFTTPGYLGGEATMQFLEKNL